MSAVFGRLSAFPDAFSGLGAARIIFLPMSDPRRAVHRDIVPGFLNHSLGSEPRGREFESRHSDHRKSAWESQNSHAEFFFICGLKWLMFKKCSSDLLFRVQNTVQDFTEGEKLHNLHLIERVIAKALQEGMGAGRNYHDIFKDAKRRVERFVDLIALQEGA